MEPITLGLLLAGTYLQHQAATEAGNRSREQIQQSLAAQRELQLKAEKTALDAAAKFRTEDRTAEQGQIEEQVTTELMKPVSESQDIRAQQTTTQGDTSDTYKTAKAASDLQTLKATEQLARLLGKKTSAGRLRMNEGIRLMDSGQSIDQLASFSRGQAGADQIAIQQAGVVDPTKMALGGLMQGAGFAKAAGAFKGVGGSASVGMDSYSAANAFDPMNSGAFTINPAPASSGWASRFPSIFGAR